MSDSEREGALAQGKRLHEQHVDWHKEHDFVPDPDNPAHRLFFRPSRNPKSPRRIRVSGKASAEHHAPEQPQGTGLRGVRRIKVSGES